MVFCEMDPIAGVSVSRIAPSRWILGSMMVGEKVDGPESRPLDALAHWQDGDGIFYLRHRSVDDPELLAGDPEADRIHTAGSAAAVWCLGRDTIVKVHAWVQGVEMAAEKIRFVAEKAPEVPIPEVFYTWVDRDLNRSYLIMKRVEGETLEKAWPKLSPLQRGQIADDVARFCVTLAANTSTRYETATGLPVSNEPWLMDNPPASHPTWRPRLLGPLSQEALQAYLANISTEPAPEIDAEFHFYHPDLGPTNVMVSDGRLSAIIDWESAAYYPRFWLATKPLINTWAFILDDEEGEGRTAWRRLLVQGLEAKGGFKPQAEAYDRWNKGSRSK